MPLSLGLILIFIGLIYLFKNSYTKAKFYFSAAFLWIFLLAYSPFSNQIIQPLERQYKAYLDIDPKIEYVLVLGHGHFTDESISGVSQLVPTALTRLSEGIRIYRQLDNAKIIVSGYAGDDEKTPHALISKEVAISLGVKEENILTQELAKDTKEEAIFVKEVVGDKKFILVTSAYHMPRAMKIFENESLNPIPAPTDFHSKDNGKYIIKPKAENVMMTEVAMHEYLGTIWNFIVEKIRSLVD